MIIAAVQIESKPGDIPGNVDKHIKALQVAAKAGADLAAFPELSITGYEPTLARGLALNDPKHALQKLYKESSRLNLTIAVGLPTAGGDKPKISQLFIGADTTSRFYSKQILHDDEKPYFTEGEQTFSLDSESELIVPAICYESLRADHAEAAAAQGATVYLACVAKPESRTRYAHTYFSQASKEYGFIVVMSNAVGKSDSFVSAGATAAWSRSGSKIGELDAVQEGILMVDTIRETATPLALSV